MFSPREQHAINNGEYSLDITDDFLLLIMKKKTYALWIERELLEPFAIWKELGVVHPYDCCWTYDLTDDDLELLIMAPGRTRVFKVLLHPLLVKIAAENKNRMQLFEVQYEKNDSL